MDYFKRKKQIDISLALIIFAYAGLLAIFLGGIERKICFISMMFVWFSDEWLCKGSMRRNNRNYIGGTILFVIAQIILIAMFIRQLMFNPNYPSNESGAYFTFRSIAYIAATIIVIFIFEEKHLEDKDGTYIIGAANVCITMMLFSVLLRLLEIESSTRNIMLVIGSGMMLVSNFVYSYNKVNHSTVLHSAERVTKWFYPLALIIIVTYIG